MSWGGKSRITSLLCTSMTETDWGEEHSGTCSSDCWTWAAAVATWSSRKASSVSVVPLLILRAHCSRSPSVPSSPYTAPAVRYTYVKRRSWTWSSQYDWTSTSERMESSVRCPLAYVLLHLGQLVVQPASVGAAGDRRGTHGLRRGVALASSLVDQLLCGVQNLQHLRGDAAERGCCVLLLHRHKTQAHTHTHSWVEQPVIYVLYPKRRKI